ncbi:patatin-like phospholipase family protein [Neisseria sp. P0006.S004]|uniref:patatin-like phospholipase family protein n=1 Tax=unclassified Neisseria TaxID=2623750 RepID=UPI003F8098E3
MPKFQLKSTLSILSLALLSACSLVKYQPVAGIDAVDLKQGYRFETSKLQRENDDDTLIVIMFSGGGTRAAALGYGVLEQLNQQQVTIGGKRKSLLANVDVVVGVSGGSVLAAYFALKGEDTIPLFYKRFLHQNFQRQVVKQAFSMSNLPRLASPEYGRGDLLQEQFENYLFGKTTFRDLEKNAKGPFAIISATDMGIGERFNFTQEYFDPMCIDLGDLRLARAVAASSSVPMVFAPITLNNNGGRCNYTPPIKIEDADDSETGRQQSRTIKEFYERFQKYADGKNRPYIHLIDGGLTDTLGMRSLLDMTEMYPEKILTNKILQNNIRHIVVINVNAQNQVSSNLDKTAAVPGFRDVVSSIVNIPIDQNSQESLRRFRAFVDQWNKDKQTDGISFSFVSLNLKDLPPSELREKVLNIPTSFYLPPEDVDNLRTAAAELMKQSLDYRNLLTEFTAHHNPDAIFAEPPPDAKDFKPLNEKETQKQSVP